MLSDHSKYGWFFKYKIYHLPFWLVYHYLWWSLHVGSVWEAANSLLFTPYSIKISSYIIFQAIGVYFNLYFLIPRFLEKGRYVMYIGFLLLTIITTAGLVATGYYVSAWWFQRPVQELFGRDDYFYFYKTYSLPSTVASMTLGMSVKLTKNWIREKRRQQLLEKEKLETELKFLKSQINPHFLFNTINSIFVLISKNPVAASESLAKFSDLLRYQLYECNEQEIPVEHELTYLENFIELARLRLDNNFRLNIQIEPYTTGSLTIAPLVLMAFVENAFKHVSQGRAQSNWIDVRLHFEGRQLCFDISNSVAWPHDTLHQLTAHGIGLKNVQRRLDLIYPEKHTLLIQRGTDEFRVRLRLDLHEVSVAELVNVSIE